MASLWRHMPNALCVLRILLILPIALLLLRGELLPALAVFIVAALTDVLDGFLAKRCGWQSELGKRLDPLADKLLLVTLFLVVASLGLVPPWLAAAAVLRDVVITAGGLTYYWLYGDPQGKPTVASKLNTFLQVCLVTGVLARQAAEALPRAVAIGLGSAAMDLAVLVVGALVFVTTVVSGLDYVLRYAYKARLQQRARHAGDAG